MTHPADLGLVAASAALHDGSLDSEQLTEACLERIAERDAALGAWLQVDGEAARADARAADRRRAAGAGGPLTGIPLGLKATIGAAGRPLTADSALLAGNVAQQDASCWRRLRAAGMVLLGHLHCGELSTGVWGRNPWDPAFSPGGSSSGSAIAVAARMAPAALGSDSRGSIRIPAGFNGVTGMKPSFGLVSTAGCIPMAYSYDTIGPLARSAADCALLLSALAGPDPEDPATITCPARLDVPTAPRAGARPLDGVRIGVPCFRTGLLSDGVAAVVERFGGELRALGATLVSIQRPPNPLEEGGFAAILGGESVALLEQLADRAHLHRADFVEHYTPLVNQVGSAVDYVRAQLQRAQLLAAWRAVFAEHELDAVAEPGATGEIWRAGEPLELEEHPWLFGTWNDANLPVLMVPAGTSAADGAPVGMQLAGLPHRDATLLRIGIEYQAATGWHLAEPPALARLGELGPYEPPPVPDAGPQPPWTAPRHPYETFVVR